MGLIIALVIIALWCGHLWWTLLHAPLAGASGLDWLLVVAHVLVQGYLSTGLFITAHDAIHGTVSPRKSINSFIGTLAAFLFAGLSYRRLSVNHHLHHAHPADDYDDPDYHASNSYVPWFVAFMRHYASW